MKLWLVSHKQLPGYHGRQGYYAIGATAEDAIRLIVDETAPLGDWELNDSRNYVAQEMVDGWGYK